VEVAPHHRYRLPANSVLIRMIFLRWAQLPQPRHLRVILPLRRVTHHRQGLDFYPRVVAAEHPEALPYPATLPQMTFPH